MANLKEVRARIKSVMSTQQITKAMKMVSAAKLRRAQDAIVKLRPFANRQNEMLANILANTDGDSGSAFGTVRPVNSALLVVVTSNRGLCGAFNSNVIKAANQKVLEDYADIRKKGKLTLLFIGKKGYDFFKNRCSDCELITTHVNLFSDLSFENAAVIAKSIMKSFENGQYDAVDVAYGKFKNAAVQECIAERYLPVVPQETEGEAKSATKSDFIFEPDEKTLLDHLVPSILQTTFFKFLLDTHASEHGARMTAMDNATENAEEMLRNLKIFYNKARQEAITKELSEIVGGAAAMENG